MITLNEEPNGLGSGLLVRPARMGMGHYTRADHETCIVATRGRGKDLVKDHGVRDVFYAPPGRHAASKHSQPRSQI